MDKRVLGRGLDALITPTTQDTNTSKERVQTLRISQIVASKFQPRQTFSQAKIEELAQSIREKGLIQPIIVRQTEGERFELIAGERRFRAAKFLGLAELPAIVRRVTDADVLEMSIIENIQREELNALEEAKAYRRLASEFGLSQDLIAQRVGKDKTSISNLLRVLNLPEKIQNFLSENQISFGHAKALLSIGDEKRQSKICDQIIQKGLSVRQAEALAGPKGKPKRSAARMLDSNIRHLEEKLQHSLGTKVRIQMGHKRGRIEIDYYSLEDLERVLKILGVKELS